VVAAHHDLLPGAFCRSSHIHQAQKRPWLELSLAPHALHDLALVVDGLDQGALVLAVVPGGVDNVHVAPRRGSLGGGGTPGFLGSGHPGEFAL
jgi:hypothetical protein